MAFYNSGQKYKMPGNKSTRKNFMEINYASAHTQSLSRVQLFATPWTVALQAPLSMEFFRQEHWSGLPCPPPEDLPNPGIEPVSLTSPALARRFFTTSGTWEAQIYITNRI